VHLSRPAHALAVSVMIPHRPGVVAVIGFELIKVRNPKALLIGLRILFETASLVRNDVQKGRERGS
jgi:hypothetical protein